MVNQNVLLLQQAKEGNTQEVKRLINENADVHFTDEYGRTPLSWAVRNENTEITEILIDAKADVNFPDVYGCTPLSWAVRNENTEIVHKLIDAKADVNFPDVYGCTPLSWAVINENTDIVHALINANANVNLPDQFGQTPLFSAVINEDTDIVHALINANANINLPDVSGRTPLSWAVIYGINTDIVHVLINANANVNLPDVSGRTPLSWAVIKNNTEIIEILIPYHPIIKFVTNQESIDGMSYSEIKSVINLHYNQHLLNNIVNIISKYGNNVPNPLETYDKLYNTINNKFFLFSRICKDMQKDNIDEMETSIHHLPSDVIAKITSYLQLEDINIIGVSSELDLS